MKHGSLISRLTVSALLTVAVTLGACSPEESTIVADDETRASAASSATLELCDPPSGPGAMAPNFATGDDGVTLTWLAPADREGRKEVRLLLARLDGAVWSDPVEIAAGEGFFANWTDLPAVAAGHDGQLVAHWLEKLGEDTYAYGVQLARSTDGGETWQRMGLLHDDASETEHGFVSCVSTTGGIQAFWLDGRAMAGDPPGSMQLRTALLGAGAAPPSTLLDERVCECCPTDAALTSAGPVVVYRDRDKDEVREIAVVLASRVGWSEPQTVSADGWRIHGCPVNGPAIAARGDHVAVAWFNLVDEAPQVKVAFSADAGASFGAPIRVDEGRPLGRVDVVLGDAGGAWVSWLGEAGEAAEIRLRRVAPAGDLGALRAVAETTQERSAGVPRMVRDNGRLALAWVEDGEPSRLRVGVLPTG